MVEIEGKFAPVDVVEPLTQILKRKVKIANFQSHLAAFSSEDRGNILQKLGSSRQDLSLLSILKFILTNYQECVDNILHINSPTSLRRCWVI